jgi:tryptophan-rich sensory protein
MSKLTKIIIAVLACLTIGVLGSLFTAPSIQGWYAGLIKPSFSPPNWLFGPAWTLLYILMGISVAIVWHKGTKNKNVKEALKLFAVQFTLNAVWSPIFFGARSLFLGLIIIIFMWIFIVKTIIAFKKVDKLASYLLYPYIAWVSFATVLNFSVWILNK